MTRGIVMMDDDPIGTFSFGLGGEVFAKLDNGRNLEETAIFASREGMRVILMVTDPDIPEEVSR